MLDDLQLDQIADPQMREVIQRLMNLVEQLSTENRQLREENQRLRDEVNRLKGEQGRPKLPARRPDPVDHSSEAERRVPRGRVKAAKNASIPIDREETREVDPDLLPPDAEFKGYEEVIVQDVTFHTDNVRFHKAKWYSPSQQRTYLADLPSGYAGQFGPTLKALIWIWYFASQMTEPKIAEFLHHLGIQIAEGQISNLLIKQQEQRHAEKDAIAEAAIAASPWQQTDDTATRVNGKLHPLHNTNHLVGSPGWDILLSKTGFTNESGYGLVGSAVRDGRRLVMVVGGYDRAWQRARESRALLEWGFSAWQTRRLFAAGSAVGEARVQGGAARRVPLIAPLAYSVTYPVGSAPPPVKLTLRDAVHFTQNAELGSTEVHSAFHIFKLS